MKPLIGASLLAVMLGAGTAFGQPKVSKPTKTAAAAEGPVPKPPPPPPATVVVVAPVIIECPRTLPATYSYKINAPTTFTQVSGLITADLGYLYEASVVGTNMFCAYGIPAILLVKGYTGSGTVQEFFGMWPFPAGKQCAVSKANPYAFECT